MTAPGWPPRSRTSRRAHPTVCSIPSGYRAEPRFHQGRLEAHPRLQQCAVVALSGRQSHRTLMVGLPDGSRGVAFVIPHPYVDALACFREPIRLLADEGWEIDLYTGF